MLYKVTTSARPLAHFFLSADALQTAAKQAKTLLTDCPKKSERFKVKEQNEMPVIADELLYLVPGDYVHDIGTRHNFRFIGFRDNSSAVVMYKNGKESVLNMSLSQLGAGYLNKGVFTLWSDMRYRNGLARISINRNLSSDKQRWFVVNKYAFGYLAERIVGKQIEQFADVNIEVATKMLSIALQGGTVALDFRYNTDRSDTDCQGLAYRPKHRWTCTVEEVAGCLVQVDLYSGFEGGFDNWLCEIKPKFQTPEQIEANKGNIPNHTQIKILY